MPRDKVSQNEKIPRIGASEGYPRTKIDCRIESGAPSDHHLKGHHRDWINACKGGPAASANFEYGARLTELGLLGVLALRLGKRVAWDAANLKVPGVAEADALVNEPCRKGWEIG